MGKLHQAIISDNFIAVFLYIHLGCDVNERDSNGKTPLYYARMHSRSDLERLLLNAGAKLESPIIDNKPVVAPKIALGWTDLTWAAMEGDVVLMKKLINEGADLQQKNDFGATALMLACQIGHIAVVKLLLENGALDNAIGNDGNTAYMLAAEYGHTDIMGLLRNACTTMGSTK
jgi:ankyrin repeat protein